MTSAWVQKRKKDQYYRLAKVRGYRSRAAYKLLQAARTYKLIRPGDKVVDFGCHPGGWLQVSREIVGPEGFVLGVDLKPVENILYSNVKTLTSDIHSPDLVPRIIAELKGPADSVISDLAPSIIGAWDVDHERQLDLAKTALDLAKNLLRQRGNVLIKLFQGPRLKLFQEDAGLLFEHGRLLKPPASRPESSEVYFLGLGFKLRWQPPEPTG
jgi:23S rRNA (uridine2552-2'-O)-methyltransferase